MLFEPRLMVSQGVTLKSDTAKNFVGTYKIVGLTHRGTISGAVNGECRTTVSMLAGKVFKPVIVL